MGKRKVKRKPFNLAVATVTRALFPLREGMKVRIFPKKRSWAHYSHQSLLHKPRNGVLVEPATRKYWYVSVKEYSGYYQLGSKTNEYLVHQDDVYPL